MSGVATCRISSTDAGGGTGREPRLAGAGPPGGHRAVRADRVPDRPGRGVAVHADRARSPRATWRRRRPDARRSTRESLAPFIFGHPEWTTLVFVNGGYSAALSSIGALPPGVTVGSLAEALRADGRCCETHLARHAPVEGSPFTALNTAFVPRRRRSCTCPPAPTSPGRCTWSSSPPPRPAGSVTHPRNLIVVERGARASVIESYVTLAEGESLLDQCGHRGRRRRPNSWVEHTRIQRESERAYHVGLTHVEQQRDSHYRSFTLAMGGGARPAQPARPAQRRERRDPDVRALPHPGRAGGGQPHRHLSRPSQLPQLGGLQGRAGRPLARGVQRQGLRAARGAEDRRQADQPEPAAERPGQGRHQAAARDLRRRREVHPRRHGGPAGRHRRCSTPGAGASPRRPPSGS